MNKKNATSLAVVLLALAGCATSEPCRPQPQSSRSAGPEKIFASPEQASEALVEANRRNDKAELLKILGDSGESLISSGDAVADRDERERFVSAYSTKHGFEAVSDGEKLLLVGDEEWPLPLPIVCISDSSTGGIGWQFDIEAGEQEILNRRIGANELNAISIAQTYVEAQHDYASQHRASKDQVEYAQRFVSGEGKHDGLYWPVKAGEQESPLGPLVADARAEGYKAGTKHSTSHPYHGYYYKILTGQGADAPGGEASYLSGSHMTGGFALVAFPASYGVSGVMTFIVNQSGIVFQKNLGADTANEARNMQQYNPDDSWSVTSVP